MAVIHQTTMVPTKLELLTTWLPARPWFRGTRTPVLTRSGGFRLDDPDGEVGIELMVVTDSAPGQQHAYLVPFAYRGAPLPGADDALIGTSEHGVLGLRWLYDGTRDPVVVRELLALLTGRAMPQAQHASDQPDPTVTVVAADFAVDHLGPAVDGPSGTVLTGPSVLTVHRTLEPVDGTPEQPGTVTAPWQLGDHTVRSTFFTLHPAP